MMRSASIIRLLFDLSDDVEDPSLQRRESCPCAGREAVLLIGLLVLVPCSVVAVQCTAVGSIGHVAAPGVEHMRCIQYTTTTASRQPSLGVTVVKVQTQLTARLSKIATS